MTEEEKPQNSYPGALQYLFGLQRFGIKLGLANIRALLGKMGDPQAHWAAVHIAGTNGKGSTAAFLESILRRSGLRVGLYTSPHLVDFSERIQVNGVPIGAERVVALTERIRSAVGAMAREGGLWQAGEGRSLPADRDPEKATITFFEFTTAMAFLHFREEKVDLAVVETGLGGRLDATNVIDPLLSIITNISLEHRQYLGNTLEEIAAEKAGIIKPGRSLLTAARQNRVLSILRKRCGELQSPLYVLGKDFSVRSRRRQVIDFHGRTHRWSGLRLGLPGPHQNRNAALALAAVEILTSSGATIPEAAVRRGLAEAWWPGRLEIMGERPRILLDGAHNPGASRSLRQALQTGFPRRRLILVLGIMADKEIARIIADLVPLADSVVLTRPRMERAASPEMLQSLASPYRKPTAAIAGVAAALDYARAMAGGEDLIVVTGSLYTVGEARGYLTGQPVVAV